MQSIRLPCGPTRIFSWARGVVLSAVCVFSFHTNAAPGPGLTQIRWRADEIGREIFRFLPESVGAQPTFVDFQHGYLYIGSAASLNGSVPGQVNWYDLSNPRQPVRISAIPASGNKPHMAAFWRDRMIDGFQGNTFRIWDFDDKTIGGSYSGSVSPVWYFAQPPYVYRPRNGYGSGGNFMEIARITDVGGTRLNLFDLGGSIGFPVGALHAVGNLLICSASQARGVAVFDISDPGVPRLLSQRVSGNNVYTSYVHGSRVYQCETGNGIRVYDFSNPSAIQEVGFIPISNNPRYVTLKDGVGYCCPGAAKLVRFDASTFSITEVHSLQGPSDFVQVVGNMAITGGNQGAERCSVIPLDQEPDLAGPTCGFANPANGAQSVAITARVGMVMNESIDVTSLNSASFIVRTVGGAEVAGTYSTQTGIIHFAPEEPLLADTTYEVILPAGGIRDMAGNASQSEYFMTFRTTGATPDGSLARWRFNQSSLDDSGNNHHATLSGGASYQLEAQEGGARLELDGSSGRATVETMELGDYFTLAAWVRIPSGRTGIQTLMSNSVSGAASHGFRWFVNHSGGSNRRIVFETGNGSLGASAQTASEVFPYDQWNHLAVTVDRVNGIARIYCNGHEETLGTQIRSDFATRGPLDIGRMMNGNFYLGGGLDDVMILPGKLTGTQIRVLAQSRLIGNWGLNGNGLDTSGFSRSLVANSSPEYSEDKMEGSKAAILGSATGYFSGAAIDPGNEFTLAAWVRIPSGGIPNIRTIFANSAGGIASGWSLYVNTYQTQDRKIILETRNGSANRKISTAQGVFVPDRWNHVAVSVHRTTGAVVIYYNGLPQDLTGSFYQEFQANGPPVLGAFSGGGFRLDGMLDDVRFHGRILNQDEIMALSDRINADPVITGSILEPGKPLVNEATSLAVIASDENPFDVTLASFNWGDGSPPSAFMRRTTAQYTYKKPGRYRVMVNVTDGVSMVSHSVLVVVSNPVTPRAPAVSSPIRYDAVGGKVWCVNPDSDTLSRLDAVTMVKELEVATGQKPRSIAISAEGAEIWVACEKSDEIRIHDTGSGGLLHVISLRYGAAPSAIVFAPDAGSVFVVTEGDGMLMKYRPGDYEWQASLHLPAKPGGISITWDSARMFVTRFISPETGGELWEVNPNSLEKIGVIGLAMDTTADTSSGGRGLPNYLMPAVITPDGLQAWVPSKKDNILRGAFRDGQSLGHDNTVRCILSRINLESRTETVSERIDLDNHSLPGAMAFSPRGDIGLVAMQANNSLRMLDTMTGNSLGVVDTGSAPVAVCVGGGRAYVLNYLSRSVGAYDLEGILQGSSSEVPQVAETVVVAEEKLAPEVLLGKKIFYNAADERMAAEGYLSCVVCHMDGGHDGRTWDFTNRGEGLRNTPDLRGRKGMGHGFVHWSANFDEIQDFEQDMRDAFGGSGFMRDADYRSGDRHKSLGAVKAGQSIELDALAAYVSSLRDVPKSPHKNLLGLSTSSAVAGRKHYLSLKCYECHSGPEFTERVAVRLHDVGTKKAHSGKRLGEALPGFDAPSLKGVFDTAPYLHDGSALTLEDVFSEAHAPQGSVHARVRTLSLQEQEELIAFLRELDERDTPAPEGPRDAWREKEFGTMWRLDPMAGDFSDPDEDGLVNRLEYALGFQPTVANPSASSGAMEDGRFSLTFTRNAEAEDGVLVVERSDSLSADWVPVARSIGGAGFVALSEDVSVTETGSGSSRQVVVQDVRKAGEPNHPARFMRLKTQD
jgi:cytochrome c peroxidase